MSVNIRPFKLVFALVLIAVLVAGTIALTKVPVYCVDTSEKKIALTFDAAWGSDKTSKIISICKENNIKATFFLVGFWVDKYPDKVKEIADAGFDIGTHSETHPQMSKLTAFQIENELTSSSGKISAITGQKVSFFRPPYGDYNNLLLETANKLGFITIQWDVDTLDWKGLSSGQILNRVNSSVKNGSIILCHNNSDHITDALPELISSLKSKGYTFCKLSELVYTNNYTIDNNGVQHLN